MAREVTIIIISGISGSGKSTALRTLEDLGFFCIDNLPILLLPKFIELCNNSSDDISKVALVIDIRERTFLKEYPSTLECLRQAHHHIEVIFLECNDSALIQRFSETRRQHPLGDGRSVLEDITRERDMLKDIKAESDRIIDTSTLNVHQLKHIIEECFVRLSQRDMVITFISFGYKYGIPHEADIVFDVRFLLNPYFVAELKNLDGTDQHIVQYMFSKPETEVFVEKLKDMLSFQIPLFEREGKSYLTVAVGCTGGRHRSVVIANYLRDFYARNRKRVFAHHRDIGKQ